MFSHVQLFGTLRTIAIALQASLSMEFSRQEYWSGLPFPSAGDLPDLGIESGSPSLQADSFPSGPLQKPRDPCYDYSTQPGSLAENGYTYMYG